MLGKDETSFCPLFECRSGHGTRFSVALARNKSVAESQNLGSARMTVDLESDCFRIDAGVNRSCSGLSVVEIENRREHQKCLMNTRRRNFDGLTEVLAL